MKFNNFFSSLGEGYKPFGLFNMFRVREIRFAFYFFIILIFTLLAITAVKLNIEQDKILNEVELVMSNKNR